MTYVREQLKCSRERFCSFFSVFEIEEGMAGRPEGARLGWHQDTLCSLEGGQAFQGHSGFKGALT